MSQAVKKRGKEASEFGFRLHVSRRLREAGMIAMAALAAFVLLSLATYDVRDDAWFSTGFSGEVRNQGGILGAHLADILRNFFGLIAYLFPVMMGFAAVLIYRGRSEASTVDYTQIAIRAAGCLLTVMAACGLVWLQGGSGALTASGGICGDVIGGLAETVFGRMGGALLLLATLLTGITLFTGLSWLWLMDTVGRYTLLGFDWLVENLDSFRDYLQGRQARREREAVVRVEQERVQSRPKPRIEVPAPRPEPGPRVEREKQKPLFETVGDGSLPSLSLLEAPPVREGGYSPEALEAMSRQVELKLADFGVTAEVVAVHPGPVITRFELMLAPGVKVSRISNLSKDLARSLSTISVRVVEVIPGKAVIGLEIPNEKREMVYLSEILNSRVYDSSASPMTLALGADISGNPVVVDLARMPHLLVAGTTGSGKSVALNAMILSLLYKSVPEDVRLILIDPKMLELSVYEGIPALLAPVVTDMKEAANALRWSVGEMERRYRLMAALGVRNIGGYNRKVKEAADKGEPLVDPLAPPLQEGEEPVYLEKLPYIVVVVDELADMMMTVGKKVEELIARLAQKARAAGIHLILATQRPSVDVITGLIKANIPSRIAFQVSSRVDSRTILDQMGAENLLGHGDMLYLPPGTAVPERIHGAFVADQEVHDVVSDLQQRGEPEYIEAVLSGPEESADEAPGLFDADGAETDELYDQAVAIVTETRRASVSGVQRRLKIGYNRAARMIEDMERAGIVTEMQSNGSREVLAPPPPKD